MKKYLAQFKPFLIFIGTFFSVYIVLTLLYKLYLNSFTLKEVDGITKVVGSHVQSLMLFFNSDIKIVQSIHESCLDVCYNNKYVIRIIEGCNAVSVIILFVSFVIAFSGKFKSTLLFILFGILLIYVLNVIRIALLTVLLFNYPQHLHFIHGVLFPLIIYGVVFALWVIWVSKFSKYAK